MGQFKPMVKMETTEPSIELKLKKGGTVGHKKMKSGGTCKMTGHKMMDGGMAPTIGTPMGGLAPSAPPAKPSLAMRRRAMAKPAAKKGMTPRATAPKGAPVVIPPMKTGGVVKGQGGYKTGGVVKGQGGYAEGGIIRSTTGKTKVVTATTNTSPAKTGDVKLGNGGGYKKGGSTKKFAEGGSVNDAGRPQKMPQGNKKPSSAVSINQLSGTFKKGGKVKKSSGGALNKVFKKENAPAMKAAKADSDLQYSKYQKMKKFADGGTVAGMPAQGTIGNYTANDVGGYAPNPGDVAYQAYIDSMNNPQQQKMSVAIPSEPWFMNTYEDPAMQKAARDEMARIAALHEMARQQRMSNGQPAPYVGLPSSTQPPMQGQKLASPNAPFEDTSPYTTDPMSKIGRGMYDRDRDNDMYRRPQYGVDKYRDAFERAMAARRQAQPVRRGMVSPKEGNMTPAQIQNAGADLLRKAGYTKSVNSMPASPPRLMTMKKGGKVKKYADGGSSFDESFASPAEQLAEMRKRKAMEKGYGQVSDRETASNEALLDSLTSLPSSVKAMVRKALRGSGAVTDTQTTVSRTVTPPAKKRGGKVRK